MIMLGLSSSALFGLAVLIFTLYFLFPVEFACVLQRCADIYQLYSGVRFPRVQLYRTLRRRPHTTRLWDLSRYSTSVYRSMACSNPSLHHYVNEETPSF